MANTDVRMLRSDLKAIPEHSLPEGFAFHTYRPGDEAAWVALYSAAEPFLTISPEVFRKEFRGEEEALAKRMLFLATSGGAIVGTSTAWYDDLDGIATRGRVHWVAIHPDWQGRGLAKPLLSETLRRLQQLGHTEAYLMTSTGRTAALSLYLSYGFRPEIRSEPERAGWEEAAGMLRRPQQQQLLRELLRTA